LRAHNAREFLWVQEEPANMGALNFLAPQLERLARGVPFRSVKRSPSSIPSTGSHTAHEMEQKTLLELAFKASSTATMQHRKQAQGHPRL